MSSKLQPYFVPIAIVVAGVLIAGAFIWANKGPSAEGTGEPKKVVVSPVTSSDHILGNPDAPIVIVEYSDPECPFCKQLHTTMKTIMDEYGANGKVAWVYRHYPIPQLHPNAPEIAEASECIAELGGNDAFWKFLDGIFVAAPLNERLDMTKLPTLASDVGVDVDAFNACRSSDRHVAKVNKSIEDALAAGATGTPYSVIVTQDGETIPVQGAQPLAALRTVIDTILADLSTRTPEVQ